MQLGGATYSDICVEGRKSIDGRESVANRAKETLDNIEFEDYSAILKANNDSEGFETHNRRLNMVPCWVDRAFGTNLVQTVPEFCSVARCCKSAPCFSSAINLAVAA